MLASLGLLAAAVLGGTAITFAFDDRRRPGWRVLHGTCIGLALLGLLGFILASVFGFNRWTPVLAGAMAAAPSVLVFRRFERREPNRSHDLPAPSHVAILLGGAAYLAGAVLLWRVANRSAYTAGDGLYTGVSHNIGDLPFHLSVMSRFTLGDNYPPQHPSFAGAGFSYPFMTDFIGGMFTTVGATPATLIAWSTWIFILIFAALLYRWTLSLTGNRVAAFIAPFLALLSGGLGWTVFLGEAAAADGHLWTLLQALPHDYTITPDGRFRWGNMVTTLLIPQRGFLLGLPLAIIVFQHWWEAATSDVSERQRLRLMAGAGFVAGLLPLVHAHGFAVVCAMGACLALVSEPRKPWLGFFGVALALALPQVWWVIQDGGVKGEAFIAWAFGWDHGRQNVVWFWLTNTGLLIPLLLAGCLWRRRSPSTSLLLRFYLPFTLCFIVPNTLRLAPWIWDNIKVLTFWYVASVPLVALVLARIAHGSVWRRALALVLFIALTASGTLDVWRVASGAISHRVFDATGLTFAAQVAEATPSSAVLLHAPVHDHPVVMSGRQSFMGYAGHVWSHGLDAGSRSADIRRIYAGEPDAAALVARSGIDYVVIGPRERRDGPVNDVFFSRYRLLMETGSYRLYDMRHGAN
jgi:hypothetical protein